MIYTKKHRVRDRAETSYRLSGTVITRTDADGRTEVFELADLRSLRLSQLPLQKLADRCQIEFDLGDKRLRIDNVHRDGIASFSARYPQFRTFVIAAMRACDPTMKVQLGSPRGRYLATVFATALILLGVFYVALFTPAFTAMLSGMTVVKFALVMLLIPGFIVWARRARPRVLQLHDAIRECELET